MSISSQWDTPQNHPEFALGVFRPGEMLCLHALCARLGLKSTRVLFDELREIGVPYESICGKHLFNVDHVRSALFSGGKHV